MSVEANVGIDTRQYEQAFAVIFKRSCLLGRLPANDRRSGS